MIKSLPEEADGENRRTEVIEVERRESAADSPAIDEEFEARFAEIESLPLAPEAKVSEPENLSEISELADDELIFSEKPEAILPAKTFAEPFDFSALRFNPPEKSFAETTNDEPPAAEITNEPINDEMFAEMADERLSGEPLAGFPVDDIDYQLPRGEATIEKPHFESPAEIPIAAEPAAATFGDETTNREPVAEAAKPPIENSGGLLFQPPAEQPRESFAETARKSGLAYAAAITLFGSVVFMLILGWFFDLLMGSSPLGVVGGIVLGALIGFFQFFRLTAQIFKGEK